MEILRTTCLLIFILSFCTCTHFENICDCNQSREHFNCECSIKELRRSATQNCNTVFSISSEQICIQPKINLNDIEELDLFKMPIHTFYVTDNKLGGIKAFSIRSCNTTSIDQKSLNGMTNLMLLSFENNIISHLHEDTFKNNPKLENINLSNNLLEILPEHIFYNLKNMRCIDLSNNRISKLLHTIFHKNTHLQYINLNQNNIKILPGSIFQQLINIKYISLAHNKLETLNENLFANLYNLASLNLNNNRISSIRSDLLANNLRLEQLYLSNNNMQTISSSIILSSNWLWYLDLENNPLVCDCTLKNFFSVYKLRGISGNITCNKSDHLTVTNFSTLSSEDLVCAPHIKHCIEKPKQICCEIFGYPTPKIHWSVPENCNNCHQLSFSSIADDRYWTNLTILDDTNTQQYVLNISNIAGSDHYLHNTTFKNGTLVEVYGKAPKILNCSEATQNLSDTVTISCSVFCHTAPIYIWKIGEQINNKYDTSIVQQDSNTYWSTLKIPATLEVEGSYTFYVENEYGGNEIVYSLKIKNTEESIEQEMYETDITKSKKSKRTESNIISQPEVQNCEQHSTKNTITISCKIFGFPVKNYTWFFNKIEIQNKYEFKQTFETIDQYHHRANLTIFYISSDTTGLYSLQVSNEKGTGHYSERVFEDSFYLKKEIVIPIMISTFIFFVSIPLIILVLYRFYNKKKTAKFKSPQEEFYEEQTFFSTNDSRKNFYSTNVLSFDAEFNTEHTFHGTSNADNKDSPLVIPLMNCEKNVIEQTNYLPNE